MEDVARIPLPDWLTLDEAADELGITRQAVSQAALKFGWTRGRIGQKMLLVSRIDVENHPRRRAPA